MKKKRIDQLLVANGFAESRQKAQAQIMSGNVLVNDLPIEKPGAMVDLHSVIRLREKTRDYVSRGAYKMIRALEAFPIAIEGRIAMDVGASTGGFTQVLLEKGIKKVYAIDVGTNQLDYRIRSNSRVISMEKKNARYLSKEWVADEIDLFVMDVSFISLTKIIPATLDLSHSKTDWITLIKPQFEAGPEEIEKGGIVKKEATRLAVNQRITQAFGVLGLKRLGCVESPIQGAKGNIEYLARWQKGEIEK